MEKAEEKRKWWVGGTLGDRGENKAGTRKKKKK
jgi:hypothetical protein